LFFVIAGLAAGLRVGLSGGGSLAARSVPEKFLRGLLATTFTGVAAKLVL